MKSSGGSTLILARMPRGVLLSMILKMCACLPRFKIAENLVARAGRCSIRITLRLRRQRPARRRLLAAGARLTAGR